MIRHLYFSLLTCLLVVMLGACAGLGVSSDKAYNFFVKTDTPLLELGPNQTTQHETTLRRGNRIRVVEGAGDGYVLVETVRGKRGYVRGADIQFDEETLQGPQDKIGRNQY
ncbi:MAG: SH3 domain-containing protein [Blastochloris sp.]|nr:SH3 domain-containing protein [Blastochloris sp.]